MSSSYDVAVVGLGPAGRALAHRCIRHGLSTLAVDPDPTRPWRPTYGVWADEIDGILPADVARSRTAGPAIGAARLHRLDREYVVLDNAALQAHLTLAGADVETAVLDDAGVGDLTRRARVVVDARGARPGAPAAHENLAVLGDVPAQTAVGVVVPAEAATPALRGRPALLMDFTPDWADGTPDPHDVATFLYAIPLGHGRVLLEETALAARPALPLADLETRLHRRLARRGVDRSVIEAPLETERVVIPMRGRGAPPVPGTVPVGTAGTGGNLVTGYSVAHSLRTADALAAAIAAGATTADLRRRRDAPPAADLLREAGLRALLRLDVAGTIALFDAFGRVPATSQRAFLDRSSPPAPLLQAMARMWIRMGPRGMTELVRATLGP